MRPTPDDRIGQIINMDLNFHHSFVKFDEHQNAKIVSDCLRCKKSESGRFHRYHYHLNPRGGNNKNFVERQHIPL